MVIDAQAHVGHGRIKSLSADDLLRQKDANGVDRAILCPVEEQIVAFNHEGNLFILDQVRRHSQRFLGFAVANPGSAKSPSANWSGRSRKACADSSYTRSTRVFR